MLRTPDVLRDTVLSPVPKSKEAFPGRLKGRLESRETLSLPAPRRALIDDTPVITALVLTLPPNETWVPFRPVTTVAPAELESRTLLSFTSPNRVSTPDPDTDAITVPFG